jgi:hypothetical protein
MQGRTRSAGNVVQVTEFMQYRAMLGKHQQQRQNPR